MPPSATKTKPLPAPPSKKSKTIWAFALDGFMRVCLRSSIHCVQYLAKPGLLPIERVFWFCTLIYAGTIVRSWTSFFAKRYLENAIYINIERDHMSWETIFPPITMCARNKVNESALTEFIRENRQSNSTKLAEFVRALVNLSYDNIEQGLPKYDAIRTTHYMSIINRLSNHFHNELVTSTNEKYPFEPVITEMGHCTTFNSRILNTISASFILTNKKPRNRPDFRVMYAQGEAYATMLSINESSSPNDVFYHGPFDVPSPFKRFQASAKVNKYRAVTLKSLYIYSSEQVRKLHQYQRKCLFPNEGNLKHSPHIYSYGLCRRECRIRLMMKVCGCLPPFYPLVDASENYCNATGIACIGRHKGRILDPANCSCYKSCEELSFAVDSIRTSNRTRGNSLRWELILSKTRFRREVKFNLIDMITSFGASSAFSIGSSFISFMEFFYFYFIKVFYHYQTYFKGQQ